MKHGIYIVRPAFKGGTGAAPGLKGGQQGAADRGFAAVAAGGRDQETLHESPPALKI